MTGRFKMQVNRLVEAQKNKDEDDKYEKLMDKLFVPIVWCRLASGFRIQDLKDKYFEQAMDMIKKYYIRENVLCRASGMIHDFISRSSFMNACFFQIKGASSLVAIDESTGKDRIAGICLARAVAKIDFGRVFSRTILRRGEAYNKCIELKTALNRKVDVYADYDCEIFLRVYAVCIKPEYRERGVGSALFRAIFQVSRALKIPIVMGIFDSYKMQNVAKKLGCFVAAEINYSDWKDEYGNVILHVTGERNKSCALMIAKVEPELYPDFLKEKPPEPPPEPKKGKKKDKKGKGGKKKGSKKKGKK